MRALPIDAKNISVELKYPEKREALQRAPSPVKPSLEETASSAAVTPHSICPENFVLVPPRDGYANKEFCVAKYEMKNDGRGHAISQAAGLPYTNITRDNAIDKCQDMGLGYDLISNDEWQALAQNIELVPGNWAGAIVGSSGGLSAGHTDEQPDRPLAAHTDTDRACFQTGQTCDRHTWHNQRRTHTLSNGEIIWDVSGNVQEWLRDNDNNVEADHYGLVPMMKACEDSLVRNVFGPHGEYDSSASERLQLGSVSLKPNLGTIHRGGGWDDGVRAGIFATATHFRPNQAQRHIGFRCVYYP